MNTNNVRRVQVRYFAVLREQSGRSHEVVETSAGTIAELYRDLQSRHGFTLDVSLVRAAVGHEFRDMGGRIHDGEEVVFIPPVAGG